MGRRKLTVNTSIKNGPLSSTDRVVNDSISLQDFISLHDKFVKVKTLEGLAQRTLIDYEKHFEILQEYFVTVQRFELDRCIEVDDFHEFLSYMVLQKKYSPFTVNIRLRTLKCYLKWLHGEGYIPSDYSQKLKLQKVPQDTIQPLSDIAIRKIFKATDTSTYSGLRDFTLMVLMLDCGIRVGEAVELLVNNINLKSGLVNIPAPIAKNRVARTVPISSKTAQLLKELVKIAEDNGSDYVFQNTYGGKIDKLVITRNFERYGQRSKLDCRTTPHTFRHTFATNFVKAGGDVFTLQRIMGHASLSTTRKYIQLNSDDLIKKHKQAGLIDRYI